MMRLLRYQYGLVEGNKVWQVIHREDLMSQFDPDFCLWKQVVQRYRIPYNKYISTSCRPKMMDAIDKFLMFHLYYTSRPGLW